jgi:hypothetical protein
MRDLAVLFVHLLTTIARLAGAGGTRAVVAESVLVKHQLLILNRSRRRAPNLRPADRLVAGVCALLMRPRRLIRAAIVLQPSTLVRLHRALVQRKFRLLFSPTVRTTPGPKGPHPDVIAAVVAMKQRNPPWGCPRIAQQIAVAFGIVMDKDVVRRILAARYRPTDDRCASPREPPGSSSSPGTIDASAGRQRALFACRPFLTTTMSRQIRVWSADAIGHARGKRLCLPLTPSPHHRIELPQQPLHAFLPLIRPERDPISAGEKSNILGQLVCSWH